jgi:hypothetical protein
MRRMKESFTPISMDDFIQKQVDAGGPMTREEMKAGLMAALGAFRSGVTCSCGNPIWVIGSALAGNACFTCITGETPTAEDYEIDEACRDTE